MTEALLAALMARRKATEEGWPPSDAQELALWAIDEVAASVKSGEYPPKPA